MHMNLAPTLKTDDGKCVPLQSMRLRGVVSDLLIDMALTQEYANNEHKPIEAQFTFPLPYGATFLGLTVRLGEKRLEGRIDSKSKASEAYEDAVVDGHAALLLEEVEPGLHSLSLGNLKPGERAVIEIRYAMPLRWQSGETRLVLPTTLAPRYGSHGGRVQPHQEVEYVLAPASQFDLELTLSGRMAACHVSSPSHALDVSRSGEQALVRLASACAAMDRDVVVKCINADSKAGDALAIMDRDMDGWAVMASFRPDFGETSDHPAHPAILTVAVDCSGSMCGDSISQARAALDLILGSLGERDRCNIVAFGSTQRFLFDAPRAMDADGMRQARAFATALDANLGGTEMEQAIREIFKRVSEVDSPSKGDILLITDGEVWMNPEFLKFVGSMGMRIFPVGVGAAVSQRTVQDLATVSGGASEMAYPGEDTTAKITRHFLRMRLPRSSKSTVVWSGKAMEQTPDEIGAIFSGDGFEVFARFAERPSGAVELHLTLDDGSSRVERAMIAPVLSEAEDGLTPLARLAADRRMRTAENAKNAEKAAKIALSYQLLSPHTNCLVVHERAADQRTDGAPELRKVRHGIAAGWHGMGSVHHEHLLCQCVRSPCFGHAVDEASGDVLGDFDLDEFADAISPQVIDALERGVLLGLSDLIDGGMSDELAELVEELESRGLSEEAIVAALLLAMVRLNLLTALTREQQRAIRRMAKNLGVDDKVVREVEDVFNAARSHAC